MRSFWSYDLAVFFKTRMATIFHSSLFTEKVSWLWSFALLKDLRLLKIISFVMLFSVDDFELFVERKRYWKGKNRSKWFVPLQERRNCFHKAGKHHWSIGQPYTADILVFISKNSIIQDYFEFWISTFMFISSVFLQADCLF